MFVDIMVVYTHIIIFLYFSLSHNKASLRVRNMLWMSMDVPQPKREPRHEDIKNSALLDIGKNMHLLSESQSIFNKDQCGVRLKQFSQYTYKDCEEMNEKIPTSSVGE